MVLEWIEVGGMGVWQSGLLVLGGIGVVKVQVVYQGFVWGVNGVRRGGYYSLYNHARDCRSAYREARNKSGGNNGIGFRVCEWCI